MYKKIKNKKGIDVFYTTTISDGSLTRTIEMFGENHGEKLPKDNFFKSLLTHPELEDYLILVEHASVFCDVSAKDIPKFQKIIKYSGSELVFKYQVLLRSIVFSIILLLLAPHLITNFIIICLIVFTICVFILSRRENIEALENSENQIADIISVHTKRL